MANTATEIREVTTMLKVHAESWHLMLCHRKYGATYEPKNLCRYFWSVMFALFRLAWDPCWLGICALGRMAEIIIDGDWAGRKTRLVGIAILVGYLVAGVGFMLYLFVVKVIIGHWGLSLLWWTLTGVGSAGGLVLIIIGLGVVIASVAAAQERRADSKPKKANVEKAKKVKSDGFLKLVWHFLIAKKRKVCPLIEVVGA